MKDIYRADFDVQFVVSRFVAAEDSVGKGFLTRIWPTPKLTKLFEDAAFVDEG